MSMFRGALWALRFGPCYRDPVAPSWPEVLPDLRLAEMVDGSGMDLDSAAIFAADMSEFFGLGPKKKGPKKQRTAPRVAAWHFLEALQNQLRSGTLKSFTHFLPPTGPFLAFKGDGSAIDPLSIKDQAAELAEAPEGTLCLIMDQG